MAKNFIKKNLESVSSEPILETEIQPSESNQLDSMARARAYENIQVGVHHFTMDNAPDDPAQLKEEIKFLANLTGRAWVILAHRAKKYKDRELYLQDGYSDFKSWIEGELDLARTMVYNYIWVLEEFGVQPVEHVKLSNLIALLKPVREHPEDKDYLLEKAKGLSRNDLLKYIKSHYSQLKEKEEDSEEDINTEDWYSSREELLEHSKFLRDGMKPKTQVKMIKELINLRLLEDPKNKVMEKMRKLLSEL
jgi:hypothetical protein